MKRLQNWLHSRWGQMLCFWGGGLALCWPRTETEEYHDVPRIAAAAVLLGTGLVLKAIATWKLAIERRADLRPRSSDI